MEKDKPEPSCSARILISDLDKSGRVCKETEVTITAESLEGLCKTYFKEFENRYKYMNSKHTSILDEEFEAQYRDWISDIGNYARAGGDMW